MIDTKTIGKIKMTKEQYESSRPKDEQKIEFNTHVIRAYIADDGSLHVLVNRKSVDGKGEELPLAYMLGHNALIMEGRK